MADDNKTNDAQTHRRPPEPNPDLKSLDRLIGTWEVFVAGRAGESLEAVAAGIVVAGGNERREGVGGEDG